MAKCTKKEPALVSPGNAAVVEKPYLKIFETRKKIPFCFTDFTRAIFFWVYGLSMEPSAWLTFLRFCCSSKLNAKSGFKITAGCTLSSDGYYFFCCQNCVWAQKMPSSSHCKKPSSASSASMLVLLWQVEPCNYLWRQSIFSPPNNCGQFLRNTSSPD